MRYAILISLAPLICPWVERSVDAALVTEDFQAVGDPDVPGFSSTFNHRIAPDEFGYNTIAYSSFDSTRCTSLGHSLFLAPATDYVTFNLAAGEYVDYAEVWMLSFQANTPAWWHVIGTEGELLQQTTESVRGGGTFARFDTSSSSVGQILEIRLTGYEGFFDDLKINIVPEPEMLVLIVAGAGALLSRRRRTLVAMGLTPLFLCAFGGELWAEPYYGPASLHRPS